MNKFRVSLQKGLSHLREALVNEGYEVCYEGECKIENTQCMVNSSGETGMLLIDATHLTHQRVLDMIKNNNCAK